MTSHHSVSFRTRCLRGLLLVVQIAVGGGVGVAHAGDAAAIATDVRIEDPTIPSSAPVHDETHCLTCRTLATAAELLAPQQSVRLNRDGEQDAKPTATGLGHVTRTFTAPLAARPPPHA